ncbi:hypothetical protein D9M68_853580 [compost metagenome]
MLKTVPASPRPSRYDAPHDTAGGTMRRGEPQVRLAQLSGKIRKEMANPMIGRSIDDQVTTLAYRAQVLIIRHLALSKG